MGGRVKNPFLAVSAHPTHPSWYIGGINPRNGIGDMQGISKEVGDDKLPRFIIQKEERRSTIRFLSSRFAIRHLLFMIIFPAVIDICASKSGAKITMHRGLLCDVASYPRKKVMTSCFAYHLYRFSDLCPCKVRNRVRLSSRLDCGSHQVRCTYQTAALLEAEKLCSVSDLVSRWMGKRRHSFVPKHGRV